MDAAPGGWLQWFHGTRCPLGVLHPLDNLGRKAGFALPQNFNVSQLSQQQNQMNFK
jgi:hypothetical protein